MAYADVDDYGELFGTVPAADAARITAWLNSVSAAIAGRLGSTTPDAEVAKFLTCTIVQRLLSTGNVRTQQSGGTSITFALVGKYITDEEWDMLTGKSPMPEAYTLSLADAVYDPCRYPGYVGHRDDGWV